MLHTTVQYKDIPSDLRANYQPSSDPQGKRNLPFKMKVEQVFEFNGKGHIATGTIETGFVKENDYLCVNGDTQHPIRFIAAEMFRKFLPYAEFEDNVGLLVDLCGHTIAPGDVLTKLGEQNTAKVEAESSPNHTESINEKEQEYLEELKECLANGSISDGERRLLNKIRSKLVISDERAAELEQSLLTPQLTEDEQEYLDAFKDAMDDGNISDAERRLLDKIKKYNNISDERAAEIEKML